MGFLDAVGETINRAACFALGNAAVTGELLNYILDPIAVIGSYNGAATLYANRCGLPLPPTFTPSAPFSGGQCTGFYRVFYSAEYRGNPPGSANDGYLPVNEQTQFNVPGKILGITSEVNAFGNGAVIKILGTGATINGFGFTTTNVQPFFRNLRITSVQRSGGLPDNCGNPPVGYPPYQGGDNIVNETVTYIDNSNNSVTIPVVIAFGYATLNANGTVNIPVNANFSLNPELNGNFNFNFNTGDVQPDVSNPSAPIPGECSDPGGYSPDPGIPTPPPDIPDAPPLPPTDTQPTERQRLLKGCIVTTTILDGNETTIFQQENPDIYVPAVGYVQFRIRIGNSSAWTTDVPVKSLRAFISCSWDAGAIEVKGTPRFGNQFTVTPVYVTRTFNPTYPPES